jgi:RNA polymerase sigma factor (sigma-70 family)
VPGAAAAFQASGFMTAARRPTACGHSRTNWDALMAAAQGGDAAAYRRLLAEAVAWLRAYYARRLPPAMIDDAIQDTLIAVHEKRHTYDPNRPFGAWLAAIARYKWIDALRSLENARKEILDDDIAIPGHEEAITSAWSLERLLSTLKPAQSEVIRLVKLKGLSIEEASKATGQSTTLVKVNIHRGLKRLIFLLRGQADTD